MKKHLELLLIFGLAFGGALHAHTVEIHQPTTMPAEAMEGIPSEYTQISLEEARSKASHEIGLCEKTLFLMQMGNNIANLVYQHAMNLAQMLSNPVTMQYYMTGAHYPRNIAYEVQIHRESMGLEDDGNDNPQFADYALVRLVLAHLDDHAISRYKEISNACEKYCEFMDGDQKQFIKNRCEALAYALPARIAAHLNLDLKNDGLPRFILGIQEGEFCQVIGFMRFGAYAKSMIGNDLSHSHFLKCNVLSNLNPGGSYAILSMMIRQEHVRKGYGSAFFTRFMEDILPRDISTYSYPEGPLSGIYMTMHTDNPVLTKFTSLLKDVNFPICMNPFIMGRREDAAKMIMLLPVNPSFVMPEPSQKSDDVILEDLEESE